ncbi:MAG: IclR family transcriptional regulator [Burkholderiales bacterium]
MGLDASKGEAVPAGSAILRAISVIEAISTADAPPQLADICRAVNLPKPTVFRILSTLEHAGLVGREPGSKRYTSAGRLNRLAGQVLLNSPQSAARHAILEELVEQLGETCNLTIPNLNSVLYLDRVEVSWNLRVNLGAGSLVPLYACASGKLFLANMPKRSRERLLRLAPMLPHTSATLCDPGKLSIELEKVRKQGFAVDDEEYIPGIIALAVPVRDGDGKVVASISAQAPTGRLRIEQAMEFLPQMKQAAESMAQTVDW